MYEKVLARVWSRQDTLTEQITCTLGVKQGDICSPILFSLYINELAINLIENVVSEKALACYKRDYKPRTYKQYKQ